MFRINKKRKILIIFVFVIILIGGGLYLSYLRLKKSLGEAIVDIMKKDPAFFFSSLPGRSYEEKGEYDKAINCYQKGIEKYPNDITLKLDLGRVFLKVERLEESKKLYEEVLLLDPKNADAHLGLSFYYIMKEKNLEQGIKELKLFLELAPPDHRERKKAEGILGEVSNKLDKGHFSD